MSSFASAVPLPPVCSRLAKTEVEEMEWACI